MSSVLQIIAPELAQYHEIIAHQDEFAPTRFDPARYIRERLGWSAWSGTDENPGQVQVIEAYVLALRQQLERDEYEQGVKTEAELEYWQPGMIIKNWIRMQGGFNTGKTKLAAGLFSHFFDHFNPSVIYTYAPTYEQVRDLLWKEITADRQGKQLSGRLLETCEIKDGPKHFAKGKATSEGGGKGRERTHGQHERAQAFLIDEGEGVSDAVYDSLMGMTSGGISIVVMQANPRTRTSRFHKCAALPQVANFTLSCLHHPNVLADREVVPSAVRRQFVLNMVDAHCDVVESHNEDLHTFCLPWEPNIIYQPDAEAMFAMLGIAPSNLGSRCFVTTGRYEAATKRERVSQEPHKARGGLDCQREGSDFGKLYLRHDGAAWCAATMQTDDTYEYAEKVEKACLELKSKRPEITSLHIRIDAGGGFGAGPADRLKRSQALIDAFEDFQIIEVHFGSTDVSNNEKYYDKITEMTADAAESLKSLRILHPPAALDADLTERLYDWRNIEGREVKKLEKKDDFRKRHQGRSPDDGDGFVLAVASDFLFSSNEHSGLFYAGTGVKGW